MSAPVSSSYTATTGTVIYGGRVAPVVEEEPSTPAVTGRISGSGIVFGDSLTALTYPSGGYRWGLPLTLYPPKVIYNAGIANHTIQDLIDRVQADVIAKAPSWVMLRAGTNSLGLSSSAFRAQYRQLLDLLLDAAIFVFVHAIPPKQGVAGSTILAHNAWLAAECAADTDWLLYVADCDALGDSNYNYIPEYFLDGIHMNGKGQYAQGKAMAPILAAKFAPADPRIKDGSDVFALNSSSNQWSRNPFNTGTGGTLSSATGVAPTNWTVSCNGIAGTGAVASIIAADGNDANQTPWLRVQLTKGATNGGTGISTNLCNPAIAADLTQIKYIDAVVEVRLVDVDTAYVSSLGVGFGGAFGASLPLGLNLVSLGNGILNERMVLRTSLPRDEASSGSQSLSAHAANSLTLGIGVGFEQAFTANAGYIDVRCASVRGLPPEPAQVAASTWSTDALLPAGTFRNISLNTMYDARPTGWPNSDVAGPFSNWSGGVYAEDFSTLGAYTIFGSGHLASLTAPLWAGVWCFDLDTLQWTGRNVPPAPLLDNSANYNSYGESIMEDTAGFPTVPHTYGGLVYQPQSLGGGSKGSLLQCFMAGNGITFNRIHRYDLSSATAAPTRVVDAVTWGSESKGSYPAATQAIASKNGFYLNRTNGQGPAKFISFADWSVTDISIGYNDYGDHMLVYCKAPFECIVGMGRTGSGGSQVGVWVCPIVDGVPQGFTAVTQAGTAPDNTNGGNLKCGGVWSTLLNCIVSYQSGGSTTVHKLTPPASGALTGTWTWSTETLTGIAGATPSRTASTDNGAWGRFIEVPAARCFIWCDGVAAPVQAWRLTGM
jgi:lysophospholipase L1-like esterase